LKNTEFFGIAPYLDSLHILSGECSVLTVEPAKGTSRRAIQPGGDMHLDRAGSTSKSKNRNGQSKIRILLVDDHPSVLNGMRGYLGGRENLKVVGQAVDGEDAVQKTSELRPDIVVMDLSLPRLTGIEAIKKIRSEVPDSKVVAYTMYDGKEFVEEALRVGARGFVLKSSCLRGLVQAIVRVRSGKIFLDKGITGLNVLPQKSNGHLEGENDLSTTRVREKCELTEREVQILKLLVDGMTTKEIAGKLHISSNTMIPHIKHIYMKLRVNTRGAVVAKALKEGLV
jgi:DNA-binding NarL/FixJ family response regulator